MQIRINVKGASRKKPAILQRVEEYPDREMTVEEFLTETVRRDPMDDRKADEEKAVVNALQCFDDGIVALFADGVRYQKREERLPLKDQSEVTFIRLTFLAGRMW